jgi:hypothetical protein
MYFKIIYSTYDFEIKFKFLISIPRLLCIFYMCVIFITKLKIRNNLEVEN